MSMSLTALPPEIINSVAANITSQPTLCNLARCSRQLYHCTIPHLYHHVTIREEIGRGEQRIGQLRNLASSLIRRPKLAVLVRHFTLHVLRDHLGGFVEGFEEAEESEESEEAEESEESEEAEESEESEEAEESEESEEAEESEESEESEEDKRVNALEAWRLSKEKKISCLGQFSHNHKSHYDFILALLLPALLKMEKLELDLDNDFDTYYLEQMMRRAACRKRPFHIQPRFEALTVFANFPNKFSIGSTGLFALLLKLPAIREISGGFEKKWDEEDGYEGDLSNTDLDSSSSPLITLDLAAYELRTADLGHLLRAPKALKTFFYTVNQPAFIKLRDIRYALAPQERCLESLGLDYDDYYDHCYGFGAMSTEEIFENFGPLSSFISFNKLKVFKITAPFLTMADIGSGRNSLINIFPPSLETLHLTRCQEWFESLVEPLEYLLAQKSPQRIPSLKTLILEESESFDGHPARLKNVLWEGTEEIAIRRLSRMAAAQGVCIDVIEHPTDEDDYSYEDGKRTDESSES